MPKNLITTFAQRVHSILKRLGLGKNTIVGDLVTVFGLLVLAFNFSVCHAEENRPNILWLTAEDIGPELGCYGDTIANTPSVDRFAQSAMRYTTAWSNYPVCAPARTTIISGAYACSGAAGNMRSEVPLPKNRVMFPTMLRRAGYYCTNNSKEDYNYIPANGKRATGTAAIWDESSKKAHYKNRSQGQPFFAVFNYTKTHESKIRKRPHTAVTDPSSLTLPPFWPDIPEIRTDLAQYYDNIAEMDRWFRQKLDELKNEGMTDNTIVFFYGDHGSGMPRFKRYAGDTGYRVAMLVHIPPAFRNKNNRNFFPGGVSDRLVSFVDLAPTVLSLAGIEPHDSMEGAAWFGKHLRPAPKFLYGFRERMDERIDLSHCIRDQRFQYTINYLPHLPAGQKLVYQRKTPSTVKWMELFESRGTDDVQSRFWQPKRSEEIYDIAIDPWATNNLIDDPKMAKHIEPFREAHRQQTMNIQDLSFFPEPMVVGLKGAKTSIEKLQAILPATFQAAQFAVLETNNPDSDTKLLKLLKSGSLSEQAWALIGLRLRKERLNNNTDAIAAAERLSRQDSFIAVDAADCLLALEKGNQKKLIEQLLRKSDTRNTDYLTSVRALNVLDRHRHMLSVQQIESIKKLPAEAVDRKRGTDDIEKLISTF